MSRIIEQGDVFFFYRPRLGVEEVDDLVDVQRFFLILKPDRKRRFRRIILGRKRLPDPREHEREWAFVYEVDDDPAELREEIRGKVYETRTRGVRVEPAARPVGEGRYAIVDHEGHTHFAYVLELPEEPGAAQDLFRIRPEASYIVAVRNPAAEAPPGVGLRPAQRPGYPPELMKRFGNRRFIALDDPQFLDFEPLMNAAPAFAAVKRGNLRLMLAGPTSSAGRPMPDGTKPGPGGWNRIHFIVDDLDAEVARLRDAGARFRNDIVAGPGGKQILLQDPSGNVVELFQPAAQ